MNICSLNCNRNHSTGNSFGSATGPSSKSVDLTLNHPDKKTSLRHRLRVTSKKRAIRRCIFIPSKPFRMSSRHLIILQEFQYSFAIEEKEILDLS